MPVDQARGISFVHIPKTAGTAFQLAAGIALRSTTHHDWREIHHLGHPSFAIVREPVDRFLSAVNAVLTPQNVWQSVRRRHLDHDVLRDMTIPEILDDLERPPAQRRLRGVCWLPQTRFVCDETGTVMVDRLFPHDRVPGLVNEWLVDLGREPVVAMPRRNQSVPFVQSLAHDDARRVRALYSGDVELYRRAATGAPPGSPGPVG